MNRSTGCKTGFWGTYKGLLLRRRALAFALVFIVPGLLCVTSYATGVRFEWFFWPLFSLANIITIITVPAVLSIFIYK